jgi:hypothetical protein
MTGFKRFKAVGLIAWAIFCFCMPVSEWLAGGLDGLVGGLALAGFLTALGCGIGVGIVTLVNSV